VGAEIHGFEFQTGSLASLRHFSPEIEFTELLSTNFNWLNVVLPRIEPKSVKYQFAGLATKPTIKLPWKSQANVKLLYKPSRNFLSSKPGVQEYGDFTFV
jgi:hypothetical protein